MFAVPALVLALRVASGPTANLSFFVLATWATTGRAQAIQALLMSCLLSLFNLGLAPAASLAAVGRYAVIFGAMLALLRHARSTSNESFKINNLAIATLLLGVFFIVHSLFVSPYPDVSILKSISFIAVFTTLLSAWGALAPLERLRTEMFVFGGMIAIIVASLPLLTTGIGRLANGSGFQGLLNQPQAFGPFVALLAAWLVGRFFGRRKMPLWQLALIPLCTFSILASEARTAGGALALSTGISLILLMTFRQKRSLLLPGLFTGRVQFTIWIGIIGLVVFGGLLMTSLNHYILKSGRSQETDLTSALEASRGKLVEIMIYNISEKPLSGIGFGIASDLIFMDITRDPIFNLPISASIEKGVMPVAIVEELGIPGGFLVLGWFIILFRRAFHGGAPSMMVLSTAVFINLGENMFFSAGGMGMLIMVLATWAVTVRHGAPATGAPEWIR